MSVQLTEDRIILRDVCNVNDAQALLDALLLQPDATVDLSACRHLHAALWQILVCAHARVGVAPTDPFVQMVCNEALGVPAR